MSEGRFWLHCIEQFIEFIFFHIQWHWALLFPDATIPRLCSSYGFCDYSFRKPFNHSFDSNKYINEMDVWNWLLFPSINQFGFVHLFSTKTALLKTQDGTHQLQQQSKWKRQKKYPHSSFTRFNRKWLGCIGSFSVAELHLHSALLDFIISMILDNNNDNANNTHHTTRIGK